jgi:hypothetical protein
MATFTIKRGDSAPALEIALSIAGTEPREYWDASDDKPDALVQREIKEIRFIMRDNAQQIVNSASNKPYTGLGTFQTVSGKTILAYSWADTDTTVAGIYNAEFEVIYENATGGYGKKRTFPSTSGDALTINVEADLNDTPE